MRFARSGKFNNINLRVDILEAVLLARSSAYVSGHLVGMLIGGRTV